MSKASDRLGWLAGLLVGLGAAAAIVLVGGAVPRPPAAGAVAAAGTGLGMGGEGAVVTLVATPTGELAVSPTEVRLGPEAAAGSFTLFNQTDRALAVSLRGVVDGKDPIGRLPARVIVAGQSIYEGPLAGLNGDVPPFTLDSGEERDLGVELTFPSSPCAGCRGALSLQFTVEAGGDAP